MGTSNNRGLIGALSATGLTGPIAGLLACLRRRCCDPSVGAWSEDPSWGDSGAMTNVEADDSLAASRHRFTFVDEAFVGGSSGTYRLIAGLREFRCQPGRGQTDWGPELCL